MARPLIEKAGVDRLAALLRLHRLVRRGGTISISGVYGGAIDPMPMMQLFDKQLQLRMGQANVRRWVDDILPLSPTMRPAGRGPRHPPAAARRGAARLRDFQKKEDGAIKVMLQP